MRAPSAMLAAVGLSCALAGAQPFCAAPVFAVANDQQPGVWLIDGLSASVLDSALIAGPELTGPWHAVCSQRQTILVSDPAASRVLEYGFDGSYLGVVVEGATEMIVGNTGVAVRLDRLYLPVPTGALAGGVRSFTTTGADAQTFIAAGTLSEPVSIAFVGTEAFVSDRAGGLVARFNASGTPLGAITDDPGAPEQVAPGDEGLLVADADATPGIYEMTTTGLVVRFHPNDTAVFGVQQLLDGRILFTDTAGLWTLDPQTGARASVASGAGFRYIDPIPIPAPGALSLGAAGVALGARRR